MLKHYLNIALRNLLRQRRLAFINVFGLSVGLTCFTLFLLFAINELNFDRFHKNADKLYRVYLDVDPMHGQPAIKAAYLPIPLAPALKQEFPDIQAVTRLKEGYRDFVRVNNKAQGTKISFADAAFLQMFSFKMLAGDPSKALNELNSVVLTKKNALKLFGSTDVLGKTVEIKVEDKFVPFIVSAVADDMPSNSSISFELLANFNYFIATKSGQAGVNNWHRSGYQTYVQLQPGSRLPQDEKKLTAIRMKYYADDVAEMKKMGVWNGSGRFPVRYVLQPLREIHTNPEIGGASVASINPKTIWILLAIAAGVLLIACINFTTLAIGRSAGRAKEIGVRKVIGGDKKQLVMQFLAEALLLSIFSAAIGFLLSAILLPLFNTLADRNLHFSFSQFPEMAWLLGGLVLLVGLLAGSYPALVLSSFKPIEVLKSKVTLGGSNLFTKSLVTLQFVVSIGLIISTVIILQQLKYMENANPGFNKENILMVDAEGTESKAIFPLFKQALAKEPSIAGVAGSELGIGQDMGWSTSGFEYEGKHKDVFEYYVDTGFIRLMDIQLLAGRNFDAAMGFDTISSVIINEAMMQDFGWTLKTAIGQQLKGYSERLTPVVIGVTKNIHFRPLSEKIEPQMFHQFHDYAPYKFIVKIKPGNPAPAMAAIQKAWSSVEHVLPLKYDFLDESINKFYQSEQRWSSIVGWAGAISIFLACMGLFGLAALAAVNRTKEIGIRKVLGASVGALVSMLSKDFLKLVAIALLIAAPLAWYLMTNWLRDFAYRIHINWIVFLVTGLSALTIALITISFQTFRAAAANPVKSLRTE
ncbi:MAG: ABC transporter permease [Chitinophagaceae bacterium]|nr:ABC transporter permease [Chitinophagaceae bacterium]